MKTYTHNLAAVFNGVLLRYADKTALAFPDGSKFTFRQLDQDSDRLASLLIKSGLNKYDVCAIAGIKQYYSYATFIACLKLGVTYSFFDPESPWERLSRIFDRCEPKLVVGYLNQLTESVSNDYSQINFESDVFIQDLNNATFENGWVDDVEGSAPAYIMFTSGSTGFPKGAAMSHDNLINFISWGKDTYSITSEDIHTNVNPLFFDNSVFDLYCSLFNGATLVPIEKNEALNPRTLLNIIESQSCTTWFSVPSLLIYLNTSKAIIPERWKSIRRIIFGGEGFPKAILNKLFTLLNQNTRFYNVYGPTECTCICSSYEVTHSDFTDLTGFLPLGNMAPNFTWVIVDENNKQAKDKGDLLLGGPNVGLGYYNDPARTQERFIQNPLNNKFSDIMYRTGDLVSFNSSDGKIYIHGRVDNQIKHMGYRIELEEIENALVRIHGIIEAAVFAVEDKHSNRIVAVYECENEIDSKEIKDKLKALLPHYMIPADYIHVDRIAKNANGKTDRNAMKSKFLQQWQK